MRGAYKNSCLASKLRETYRDSRDVLSRSSCCGRRHRTPSAGGGPHVGSSTHQVSRMRMRQADGVCTVWRNQLYGRHECVVTFLSQVRMLTLRTACVAGTVCTKLNDYYFQCLPSTVTPSSPLSTPSSPPPSSVPPSSAPPSSTPNGPVPTGFVGVSGQRFTLNGAPFTAVGYVCTFVSEAQVLRNLQRELVLGRTDVVHHRPDEDLSRRHRRYGRYSRSHLVSISVSFLDPKVDAVLSGDSTSRRTHRVSTTNHGSAARPRSTLARLVFRTSVRLHCWHRIVGTHRIIDNVIAAAKANGLRLIVAL